MALSVIVDKCMFVMDHFKKERERRNWKPRIMSCGNVFCVNCYLTNKYCFMFALGFLFAKPSYLLNKLDLRDRNGKQYCTKHLNTCNGCGSRQKMQPAGLLSNSIF